MNDCRMKFFKVCIWKLKWKIYATFLFFGAISSLEVNDGVIAAFNTHCLKNSMDDTFGMLLQAWIGMLWKQSYYSENCRSFLLSFLYLHCMKETPGPPFSRGVWAFLTPTIYIVKYTWATVMSTIFSCQKCKAFCYNKYLFLEVIVYQAFHFYGFFVK